MVQQEQKSFASRFDIDIDIQEAKNIFVHRAITLLKEKIQELDLLVSYHPADRHYLIRAFYAVGRVYQPNLSLEALIQNNFPDTLRVLESLYNYALEHNEPDVAKEIYEIIIKIIRDSEIDIGITWRYGQFCPCGAELLDDILVNESLRWLSDNKYNSVLTPFSKGLRHLLESNSNFDLLSDVITDTYESLEAMAKILAGNDKDLSANKDKFIAILKLNESYKKILSEYISYGCQYRHAAKNGTLRKTPQKSETEAFVYMTGIFLRLSIQRVNEES